MANGHPGSFRIFNAFGIDVFLHWTWFLIAFFQIRAMRGIFDGPVWHVLVYLSLFGIVLLHEFGHALACRSVGGRAERIVLWPLGGIAFVQPPDRPGAVLWSIAAGPLVNVVLAPITFGALLAVNTYGAGSDLATFVYLVTAINTALLLFNILPVYPLDGGQILQAILWFFMGRAKSLMVAAGIGLVVTPIAALAALPRLLEGNILLFVLILFVGWQAWNGMQRARILARYEAVERDRWKM